MTRREIEAEIGELECRRQEIDERIDSLQVDLDSENYDPDPDEDA